jgi:hypothetical protein
MGYLANGPVIDGLIEVEDLTLALLYDEQLPHGHCALRLAGYCGARIPWGVRFGSPDQCKFFKDLSLQPVPGARGYRLDLDDQDILSVGLGLEREMDRCARYRHRCIREQVYLPKLWAGFQPADAAGIYGDGPELAAYASRTGKSPRYLLERLRRDCLGLAVYPLPWVSHHWQQAVAVFTDLGRFPKRQVFRLRQLPDDLVGFQGAVEFDLHSHFRQPAALCNTPRTCASIAGQVA